MSVGWNLAISLDRPTGIFTVMRNGERMFSATDIWEISNKIYKDTKDYGDLSERDLLVLVTGFSKLVSKLIELESKKRMRDEKENQSLKTV